MAGSTIGANDDEDDAMIEVVSGNPFKTSKNRGHRLHPDLGPEK